MICPACGAANEDGVLFCEKCKADLEMPASAPATAEPPPVPVMESVYSPPDASEQPIELEPIALEPVVEPPTQEPPPKEPETREPPTLESTGDLPALGAALPKPGPSDDFPTTDLPQTPPQTPITLPTPPPMSEKLVVVRGQKIDAVYPIYPGKNYMGRTDDKPVDIDLEDQEAQDRIWSSRQHAVITMEEGKLTLEDLNSLNGTFVNRNRVHPGQLKELISNDVIQIGTVHLKVVIE